MKRALIVSAGKSSNEYLYTSLTQLGFSKPLIVPSANEARRLLCSNDFGLIVANAPLPDEFGHEFCSDAAQKTRAGVVLIAKAESAEALMEPLGKAGVVVLQKPFTRQHFLQCMQIALASAARMRQLEEENLRLKEKIQQLRQIDRAKCLLISRDGMSEAEAHRLIEKRAMDERKSRGEIAQEILASDGATAI